MSTSQLELSHSMMYLRHFILFYIFALLAVTLVNHMSALKVPVGHIGLKTKYEHASVKSHSLKHICTLKHDGFECVKVHGYSNNFVVQAELVHCGDRLCRQYNTVTQMNLLDNITLSYEKNNTFNRLIFIGEEIVTFELILACQRMAINECTDPVEWRNRIKEQHALKYSQYYNNRKKYVTEEALEEVVEREVLSMYYFNEIEDELCSHSWIQAKETQQSYIARIMFMSKFLFFSEFKIMHNWNKIKQTKHARRRTISSNNMGFSARTLKLSYYG
eukprot:931244_1